MHPEQAVTLTTDAFPGERFGGRIERIAPVFRVSSRQARVEMRIENPMRRLKPGMFINASVELGRVEGATIVPEQAVTRRGDRTGVFIVDEDGTSAIWKEVKVGIRQDELVQVAGDGLSGRVVTLGQQMISDGARISIASERTLPAGDSSPDNRKRDS